MSKAHKNEISLPRFLIGFFLGLFARGEAWRGIIPNRSKLLKVQFFFKYKKIKSPFLLRSFLGP